MDIDFVVMWVDDTDPVWFNEKKQYEAQAGLAHSNTPNRFRDWGLLKYWFRAVEEYAPWVRKVHFVTYGHLLPFLNTSSDRINIVKHTDFMPKEALPTYNSSALELNLWRIEGLSEHFVYFNDDMYLIRACKKSDFFDEKTGHACLPFEEIPLRYVGEATPWQMTSAQNIAIINKNFNKRDMTLSRYPGRYLSTKYPMKDNLRSLFTKLLFPEYYTGFKNHHTYAPLTKTLCKEVWEKEPGLLYKTTVNRFRKMGDVNHWLYLWWQLAEGAFVPKKPSSIYFDANNDTVDEICELLFSTRYESVCINDPDDLVDDSIVKEKLVNAFVNLLPYKSSFEK